MGSAFALKESRATADQPSRDRERRLVSPEGIEVSHERFDNSLMARVFWSWVLCGEMLPGVFRLHESTLINLSCGDIVETDSGMPNRSRHGGRRNRQELGEGHSIPSDRDEIRQFSPSPAQARYRACLVAVLEAGAQVTDTALCRRLSMSRQNVWEWRQDADFRSWMRVQLDSSQTVKLRAAISCHIEAAMLGSTASLRVLA